MSNNANPKQRFAVVGLLGFGAVVSARVIRPLLQGWESAHTEACPLLADCSDEELDRWANEGGCCALAPKPQVGA